MADAFIVRRGGKGLDTSDATATASDILLPKTAYVDGEKVTGSLELTGNAVNGDVISGKTFYTTDAKTKLTGGMTNRGAIAQTISVQGGQYTVPAGYHNGSGKVTANVAEAKGVFSVFSDWQLAGTGMAASGSGTRKNTLKYENNMFIAGVDGGKIYSSTNGVSWTERYAGTQSFNSVVYGDGIWIACGNNKTVLRSTNGTSWSSISPYPGGSSFAYLWIDYGSGVWAITYSDRTLVSTNGGVSWTEKFGAGGFQTVATNKTGIWLASKASGVYKSTDNLTSVTQVSNANFSGLYFMGGKWIGLAASSNALGYSENDGTTWAYPGLAAVGLTYINGVWIALASDGTLSLSKNLSKWYKKSTDNTGLDFGSYSQVCYGQDRLIYIGYNNKSAYIE